MKNVDRPSAILALVGPQRPCLLDGWLMGGDRRTGDIYQVAILHTAEPTPTLAQSEAPSEHRVSTAQLFSQAQPPHLPANNGLCLAHTAFAFSHTSHCLHTHTYRSTHIYTQTHTHTLTNHSSHFPPLLSLFTRWLP